MINFLQIVDTATQLASNISQTDVNQDGQISLGELLTMGGLLMLPLALLFLLTIYFFVKPHGLIIIS
jgi:biopolymer transport protein ExbB